MAGKTFSPSAIAAFAAISLAFASCANPADGPATPSGPAIDKALTWIICTAEPSASEKMEPTQYSARCQIQNYDNSTAYEFPDAIVTINGRRLTASDSKTYFRNPNIGSFKTGDELVLIIEEERLGKITVQGTIPASPIGFTLTPELPPTGTKNQTTEYALSWAEVPGANKYTPSFTGYDVLKEHRVGRGYFTDRLTYKFSENDFIDTKTAEAYPYLSIRLSSIHETPIGGFHTSSSFQVKGPTIKEKTNL